MSGSFITSFPWESVSSSCWNEIPLMLEFFFTSKGWHWFRRAAGLVRDLVEALQTERVSRIKIVIITSRKSVARKDIWFCLFCKSWNDWFSDNTSFCEKEGIVNQLGFGKGWRWAIDNSWDLIRAAQKVPPDEFFPRTNFSRKLLTFFSKPMVRKSSIHCKDSFEERFKIEVKNFGSPLCQSKASDMIQQLLRGKKEILLEI